MNPKLPEDRLRDTTIGAEFEAEIAKILLSADYKQIDRTDKQYRPFENFKKVCEEMAESCFIHQYPNISPGLYSKANGVTCDFLVYDPKNFRDCLVIEAKWQKVAGTVEEKFPYLVENLKLNPCPSIVIMGGGGITHNAEKWLKDQVGVVDKLKAVFSELDEFEDWLKQQIQQGVAEPQKDTDNASKICMQHVEVNAELKAIMAALPSSQKMIGRHRCVICAYEQGIAEGQRLAKEKIQAQLQKLLD